MILIQNTNIRRSLRIDVFAEDRDECSFIWDNYYDEEDRINEYELSLFVRSAEDHGIVS